MYWHRLLVFPKRLLLLLTLRILDSFVQVRKNKIENFTLLFDIFIAEKINEIDSDSKLIINYTV